MYIISACLAGVNCKYNGKNNFTEEIMSLIREGKAMLVCPEQLGGLSTPRLPSEIVEDKEGKYKVINNKGEDVTKEFKKGAEETLRIANSVEAKIAILKARSPSCGYGEIYDGTFKGNLKKGNGITAQLLIDKGINVYTEETFLDQLIKED